MTRRFIASPLPQTAAHGRHQSLALPVCLQSVRGRNWWLFAIQITQQRLQIKGLLNVLKRILRPAIALSPTSSLSRPKVIPIASQRIKHRFQVPAVSCITAYPTPAQ
jgi:hypothetical protein